MSKVSEVYEVPKVEEVGGQLVEVELVANVRDAPRDAVLFSACTPLEALETFAHAGADLPKMITGLVQGEVKEGSGVLWYVPVYEETKTI